MVLLGTQPEFQACLPARRHPGTTGTETDLGCAVRCSPEKTAYRFFRYEISRAVRTESIYALFKFYCRLTFVPDSPNGLLNSENSFL